jgi:hypothetical protein
MHLALWTDIVSIKRRNNSKFGNPSFAVTFLHGEQTLTGYTKANAGFAYAITGAERIATIEYHMTPKGKVVITDLVW